MQGGPVRVPEPVRWADGSWVAGGRIVSHFVPGLVPMAPDWDRIIGVGLRFGEAATALAPPPDVLHRRTHRWAVADRVAWDEADVDLDQPEARELLARLRALVPDGPIDRRAVVHGDLTGNVFLDSDGQPVVLDISPYLRAPGWGAAVVTADAVLWNGAPLTRAAEFDDRGLLARALIYRMVAEQLAPVGSARHGALLEPYEPVVEALA
jgi:hypothetical protein